MESESAELKRVSTVGEMLPQIKLLRRIGRDKK